MLRASQYFVVGQGLREESPAWDILIRIGIAWMEVGVRDHQEGWGQLSMGAMGSDNEFGVSFSCMVIPLKSSKLCYLVSK